MIKSGLAMKFLTLVLTSVALFFTSMCCSVSAQVIPHATASSGTESPGRLSLSEALKDRIALALSPDQTHAVVGEDEQSFRVIRLSDFTTVAELVGHGYRGWQSAAMSADNRYLYTVVWDEQIADASDTLDQMSQLKGVAPSLRAMIQKSKSIQLPKSDSFIHRWDLSTGELVDRIKVPGRTVTAIIGSPNGEIASVFAVKAEANFQVSGNLVDIECAAGEIRRESPLPNELVAQLQGFSTKAPVVLKYSGNGRSLFVGSNKHAVLLDRQSMSVRWQASLGPPSGIFRVAFALHGNEVWWFKTTKHFNEERFTFVGNGIDLKTNTRLPQVQFQHSLSVEGNGDHFYRGLIAHVTDQRFFFSTCHAAEGGSRPRIDQSFTIDRQTGQRSPVRDNLRFDLMTPDQTFLSGVSRLTPEGLLIQTVEVNQPIQDLKPEKLTNDPSPMGNVLLVNSDDRYALFENASHFTIWNLHTGLVQQKIDRPSDAMLFQADVAWHEQTASVAAFNERTGAFLIAIPQPTRRDAASLRRCIGSQITARNPIAGAYTISTDELFDDADPNALIAFAHNYCGSRWRLYQGSIDSDRLTPLAEPIEATAIAVSPSEEAWVVATIPPDHSELRFASLSASGMKLRSTYPAKLDQTGNVKLMALSSLSLTGSKQQAASMVQPQAKLQFAIPNGSQIQLIASDNYFSASTLFLHADDLNAPFQCDKWKIAIRSDSPLAGLFPGIQFVARPSPQTNQVAILSTDTTPRGDNRDSSSSLQSSRSQQARFLMNVLDIETGRQLRQYAIPENAVSGTDSNKFEQIPIDLQLDSTGKYFIISTSGSQDSHVVLNVQTQQVVRKLPGRQAITFLHDGKHAIIGDQVIELTGDGSTFPIADFCGSHENEQ